jgi:hypothetical protein
VALKPDAVIIRGELSVTAESAGEALTKYRDSRRRAIKMLEDLAIPNFSVTGSGPTIGIGFGGDERMAIRNMMFADGGENAEPKASATETLVVKITGITDLDAGANAVAKVIDKAKEAGIRITSPDLMSQYEMGWLGFAGLSQRKNRLEAAIAYVVGERAKMEEAACAKAMEDARRRAEMLARLAGRKLGAPTAISQEETPGEKTAFDGTFRARLRMTFAIE